jgi:Cd2+/Zn2+-exporting ATPase
MTATPSFKTQSLQIGGMDCASCALKIESGLQKLSGVVEVSVNAATGRLTVSYDAQQVEEAEIQQQIKKMGYQVLEMRSPSTPSCHPGATRAASCSSQTSAHDHQTNCEHTHSHPSPPPPLPHPQSRPPHHSAEFHLRQELPIVLLVVVLFLTGLVFAEPLRNTPYRVGEYAVYLPAYLLGGWSVLIKAGRNSLRGQLFDENFLMTVATLGAIAIHFLPEAVAVMLFYKIGELFQEVAVQRSRRSIQSLLEVRPDIAHVQTKQGYQTVSPEGVEVGSTILVKPGEKIPLDGEIVTGRSQVDTSALTGESVPRSAQVGDRVLAGMINQSGALTVRVNKRFTESSIARLLELVESASSKKAIPEKFITRFAQRYTPAVVFLSLAVALVPPLVIPAATHADWIYRALTLLVISCPCGLVISIPLSYFGGVGGAARRGILVKGSTYLDTLAAIKTVVFDKTGTLTKGVFNVTEIVPKNGLQSVELLALAAKAESHSNHPVAQSIRLAYGAAIDTSDVHTYSEIAGHGIRVLVNDQVVIAGNDRLLHHEQIAHDGCEVEGTVVHLAVDQIYAGHIIIADELKEDAVQAIQALRCVGVEQTIMLTGDRHTVAEQVAQTLGLDDYQADLLPEDKVTAFETVLQRQGKGEGKVAFVGDGINDAPVLARADVGIAMGGLGSDAAIATADVVIMTDAPSKVAEAIQIGRKTHHIVLQNIALAMTIKGLFILLGIVGVATLWEAVFADVGVALLAILNATRALK